MDIHYVRSSAAVETRHLGNHILQARIVKGKRTERRQPETRHARLVLALQYLIEQALTGIILPAHLSPLCLQLACEVAAIAKPVLRTATNSVPGLSGGTDVACNNACTALARPAGRADCARLFQASWRMTELGTNWLCLP